MIDLSIAQTKQGLKDKKFSAVELTQAYLDRIAATDEKLHSYITVTGDLALKKAKEIDKKGDYSGLLEGIPMNLKDVVCTAGIKTTACSKILENFVPPYNAHMYDRLLAAGSILLGKTNTDEFTMGSSSENSYFGVTHNPWNLEYVSGGSSGGPAASVSADQCAFSIGTDTGGSIRQPASLCGTVGLKVTYGRVPRHGCISYASSFDTIGPFTKTVEDAALVLQAIAGRSEKDATTPDMSVPDYSGFLKEDLKGVTLGVPKEYFAEGVEKEVSDSILEAIEVMKKLGAKIIEVSLPLTKYAIPTYYILVKSEGSTNMARYDGIKYGHTTDAAKELQEIYMKSRSEGFGDEVKRTIMLGTYALSAGYYDAFYLKAAKVRALMKKEFEEVFEKCDALITPTSPTPAFKIGEKTDDPLAMYMCDVLTTPINLAGICGMSVPAGFSSKGLPIGLQIIANQFKEDNLFHVGHAFEQATEWHKKKPALI
ncbi:Asp-tRNA(Asn)/Glu-tRNA(Gln) amidotransferase subunit GatA [Patescibacteria group bacterium]|nr:Asp-tRNA(Asn)/Glu-tRNA(Gln) amidotransferase subunit GatA [Patescibacteria group bacterium]MBU1015792.1 Asp-tRNA(Asn)/Glu-tRNA(Gln) amidotransferase subunit GatA [Patescibacteria group bacterium]MBU1685345.1 Asp-tRNA(Asn)/Glu-tRNA(Gln) amidotransferase subunit GatA [Patescibacteria group bacterium]MBU1938273.1 Asp-tRNA(Asn)/Glu-tRNA(Gln) amidotransferase subunit GatA [Patescibacteria group bacterium]